MDYKKYLLEQSAVNLQYIAKKMWPGNKNAQTYLSSKISDKGRPWTDSDNEKAKIAIHELGLQLIKDSPMKDMQDQAMKETNFIEAKPKPPTIEQKKKMSIWEQMDLLREGDKPGAVKQKAK